MSRIENKILNRHNSAQLFKSWLTSGNFLGGSRFAAFNNLKAYDTVLYRSLYPIYMSFDVGLDGFKFTSLCVNAGVPQGSLFCTQIFFLLLLIVFF